MWSDTINLTSTKCNDNVIITYQQQYEVPLEWSIMLCDGCDGRPHAACQS